jgi:N-acetylmuramoyl-L-alanine amidase
MRKGIYILLLLFAALPLPAAETNYTVVLDAGHGGKDPGAVGRFSKEKDLNLSLVLKMGELLKEQYPDLYGGTWRDTVLYELDKIAGWSGMRA